MSFALVALLSGACVTSHEDDTSACELAQSMRDDAIRVAELAAPACVSDSDCVMMSWPVECPGIVRLSDCGFAMHRDAVRRYSEMDVNEAICHAVAHYAIGCSTGPSCAPPGAPACRSGQCVALPAL